MIISAPTALYNSLLPKNTQDPTNITFTISSNDPPRPTIIVQPINITEEIRPLPTRSHNNASRKLALGELVFTQNEGSQINVGSNMKSFESGQILNFDDDDQPPVVSNLQAPSSLDVQHNTNRLDFELMGLDDADIVEFKVAANKNFELLTAEYSEAITQLNAIKINIENNQKILNEVRKAKLAAIVLDGLDSGGFAQVVNKLVLREEQLLIDRDRLTEQYNALTENIKLKFNEILELKEVLL